MEVNIITKNKKYRIKSLYDNILSHNQMAAFFSGTDISTLRSEGDDQNCFVSLIVNNAGTYCAAVTRKIQRKTEITTKSLGASYKFFGGGEIKTDEGLAPASTRVSEEEVIEYFMLDVEVETVDNPLAYLDTRFDEIEAKKKKNTVITPPVIKVSEGNRGAWLPHKETKSTLPWEDEDFSFREYLNKKQNTQEPTLFPKEEMDELIDADAWEPDPTIIHKLVCQMVCCSLIVNDDIDLKQWITRWMSKKYKQIFGLEEKEGYPFQSWKDFIVEFMLNQYLIMDKDIPEDYLVDTDMLNNKIASAMCHDIYQYASDGVNAYMDEYKEALMQYSYE